MNKIITKITDKLAEQTLKVNANSTSSIIIFEPECPSEVRKYSKAESKD